ncbi:Protein GrpE [Acaryochloris thomasi RCC1774]|uniref:Protein GrpE n=1 Tax=Acaryochloris thomasi RCC1774 TaxID=1764569 RepID=A0A2W1JRW1_9CYAN|nr:nucleotide exchange factor GrpE [Acaryochloris thomasi]PZD71801.1 Protein GrpE [Acaryochloris thomasi RCC1774]
MSGDEQQNEYQGDMQPEVDNPVSSDAQQPQDLEMGDDAAVEVPIVEDIPAEIPAVDATETAETTADGSAAPSQESTEETTDALQQKLEGVTGQYMRIAADFDNFRKRTEREKSDLEQRVKRETISELLPVIDSFERAKSHINPQTEEEINIQKSYQGVYKQLVDCLKRIGVAPMRAQGKEFDPNLHEAIMREPTDQFTEGEVMEELVNGYMIGDLVLRHAMVKVAAPAEPMLTSEENSPETLDSQAVE